MRGRFFTAALLQQPGAVGVPSRAALEQADVEAAGSMHDPPLAPRDEAVFLLTAAAEIEHALMVQYLYAAYSVRVSGESDARLKGIQGLLFQIAREEMGHLATVQNLLHLIGGPLNFNREHSPYASEIYPFRFKLEPLTLDSLAKYVVAESPAVLPDPFPEDDEALLTQLVDDAKRSNDGHPVRHVGPIFARLKELFRGGEQGLRDEDFRLDRHPLQAKADDWGFEPKSATIGESLIVASFGGSDAARGRITHPRARAWVHLFNLRYRLLLGHLSHFLRLSQGLYIAGPGAQQGDRTARGLLLIWTFNEMRRLKKIATKLVQLPRDDPSGDVHAGPPFELPYTLNLPDREEDRWRTHLDVSRASVRLVREQLQPAGATDEHDGFLDDLVALDEQAQAIMQSLAGGTGVPEGSLPTDFRKAVLILEEAVRGFDIGPPHAHFWAEKTRDRFLQTSNPAPPVPSNPQGGFDFDPGRSVLVQRLEGSLPGQNRMPRFRPKVPPERMEFLRDWISDGCRDSVPAGEIGLRRERPPEEEPSGASPPGPTTPLGFAANIQPLFRDSPDRDSMLAIAGFDLHRFEDVRDHALARLTDGSMPCDGSWPPDRIATFRKWIDDGKRS